MPIIQRDYMPQVLTLSISGGARRVRAKAPRRAGAGHALHAAHQGISDQLSASPRDHDPDY